MSATNITKSAPLAGKKPVRRSEFIRTLKKDYHLYLLLLLPTASIILFKYLPMIGTVLAFREFRPGDTILGSKWVGLKYFQMFLFEEPFQNAFLNSLILSVLTLVICFPLPILFALLLNEVRSTGFKRIIQTSSYLPRFISTAIVVGMIKELLSPQTGVVNNLLLTLGLIQKPIYFLAEQAWFRPIYLISEVWQWTGWSAIIYLAALTGIDVELYDAAMIDGAGRLRQTIHVTLPGIMPTIVVLLILAVGGILGTSFEKVFLLQHDAILHISDTLDTYVYRAGFGQKGFRGFSYATAVGLFNAVIGMVLITSANRFARRFSDYSLF